MGTVDAGTRSMRDPHVVASERASRTGWRALSAGVLLIALAGLAGLYLALHREPDSFDRWAHSFVSMSYHSPPLVAIADIGNPVVVAVVGLAGALLVVRRDRRRAVACLAGPLLGGVLAEFVLKPLVDPQPGGLTFPSGHTDGIAALFVVLAIASPGRVGRIMVVLGTALGIVGCYAVVALGWHSPTGAVAGLAVGGGAVLLVDGALHVIPAPPRRAMLRR